MKVPKISRKQAEKVVKDSSFKIDKKHGYTKKEIKKAKKFKKKHGFRYEDSWSLDRSIALYVLPRLVQLRDKHYGFPATILENPEDSSNEELNKKANKKWNKILNKMIYGFYLYITKESFEMSEEEKVAQREGFALFKQYYSALWD